jgi:hypothetical protein
MLTAWLLIWDITNGIDKISRTEHSKMLKDQESNILLLRSTACSTFNPLNINTHTTPFRDSVAMF